MKDLFAHFGHKKAKDPPQTDTNGTQLDGDVIFVEEFKKVKGKKKKESVPDSGNETSDVLLEYNKSSKKRKKSQTSTSKTKQSLRTKVLSLKKDSGNDSSEEGSPSSEMVESDIEEERITECLPKKRKRGSNSSGTCDDSFEELKLNDSRNSLLNYFNKVDKLPDLPTKPTTLQVQAIVHEPPSVEKKTPKIRKKKKSKKERLSVEEFDLITSEEDNQSPEQKENVVPKNWNLRIRLDPNNVFQEGADSLSSFPSSIDYPSEDSKTSVDSASGRQDGLEKPDMDFEVIENSKSSEDPLIASIPVRLAIHEETNDEVICIDEVSLESCKTNGLPINDELSVIDVDEVVSMDEDEMKLPVMKPKHDGTLMSFFKSGNQKNHPKPISVSDKKAKIRFLSSGVPDVMKKMLSSRAREEKETFGTPAPFPKHSHIKQVDRMSLLWNLREVYFPPKEICLGLELPPWSSIVNYSEGDPIKQKQSPLSSSEIKEKLKIIKKREDGLPISEWGKTLRQHKKENKTNKLWTSKYKPQAVDQFLGNRHNIGKLQSWLEGYKKHFKEIQEESSSDEFVGSDDEAPPKKNVALLLGPCASGKTSAVYSIAESLGYKVLEVNSSSDRTGKKILHELQEATQSHKVKHKPNLKQNKKKAKKKLPQNEVEMSLILIEDADVIFDQHDEGFSAAVSSLASSSKRPLVLIANQHPAHLGKLTTNTQLTLHFKPHPPEKLGPWLQVLSLVEGFSLPDTSAASLSNTDIRKALLNLQFYEGDACLESIEPPNNVLSLWTKLGDSDFKDLDTKRFSYILSTLDLLCPEEGDLVLRYWKCEENDSCATTATSSSSPSSLISDIQTYLRSQLPTADNLCNQFSKRWDEVKFHMDDIDSNMPLSSVLSRRSYYLDYLPSLRKIAENEKHRLATHTKRNNRFLNYFHNLGFPPSESLTDFLVSTFS